MWEWLTKWGQESLRREGPCLRPDGGLERLTARAGHQRSIHSTNDPALSVTTITRRTRSL